MNMNYTKLWVLIIVVCSDYGKPPKCIRQWAWFLNALYQQQQQQQNALDTPSLTANPGIISVANAEYEIFQGQENVLELENNPFTFNQDYD